MYNFDANKFINKVKEKYTFDINIIHSERVSGILSKNKNLELYNLDKIIESVDWDYMTIPSVAYTFDPIYIKEFEKLLKDNYRDFSWFTCWYNFNGVGFEVILICPADREEQIYNKLLRFEKLKAFL